MKQAAECIKSVVTTAKKSDASFDTEKYRRLDSFVKQYVSDADLEPVNEILSRKQLRKITADDVVRVAYVHARSIHENNGQSPVARIESYCKANGYDCRKIHIRVITELLVRMDYMKLTKAEDRRAKTCRVYDLSPEVVKVLSPDPK